MDREGKSRVRALAGAIPNRLQLAGGWIDQPFMSECNSTPPGSMVVVQIEPDFIPMARSGFAGSTRCVAARLWNGRVPDRPRMELVRELYAAENQGKSEPSGSQDMIGLIYPGVSRLDYNHAHDGGVFPVHIESCTSVEVARWLERVLHLVPVAPRPAGYNPLGIKNLDPEWVSRLGRSGADCFAAIVGRDVGALGSALNLTMECWARLLPQVVADARLEVDLGKLLAAYQGDYPGAMFSGCGGGYLIVASEDPVPGALHVTIRVGTQ